MDGTNVTTQFAPAERASRDQLGSERQRITDAAVRQVLDGCPNAAAILNASRQIVFCNRALVGIAEGLEEEEVWGARPGEVLNCQHANELPGGCGTTEFCRTCGAVLAILDGQEGKCSTRDCRITRIVDGRSEAVDLRVTVAPMPVAERFVLCAIQDVSHEARRRALERIFFHDILNTAVALQTRAETLCSSPSSEHTADTLAAISRCAERLLAEIESQRMLLTAENGDLSPRPSQTTSVRVARDVIHQFDMHPIAEHKHLTIGPSSDDVRMRVDTALLDRVLVNMVKNALEASRPGGKVTVTCRSAPPDVEFQVHNQGTIPHVVRLQIFQRSFSTKGPARGLGTYSMKLFAEYLNGRVWFETSPEAGTTFFLTVPANALASCP